MFYCKFVDLICGWYLKLDQFVFIVDFLIVICYCEQGVEYLEVFEVEVKGRFKGFGLNCNLYLLFDILVGRSKSIYIGGGDYGELVLVNFL